MYKSVVVIQARTTSNRLPAKALLPISGMPMVVLAAKRAANTGKRVIVATSDEPSDDPLVEILQTHQIEFHRGSLENVLDRFIGALNGCPDETMVYRLTADNVFPDGSMIDEIEAAFDSASLDYMVCGDGDSGLPYGMKVEVMTLRVLRQAGRDAESDHDLEHVTPYVKRNARCGFFSEYKAMEKNHLRCTVDFLEDYLRVSRVFAKVRDPVSVSAFELVQHLSLPAGKPAPEARRKLVLGAAQLGFDYGIANRMGRPGGREAQNILEFAVNSGVEYIDTASDYGESERIVGRFLATPRGASLKCVTKLTAMRDCPIDAPRHVVEAFVDASVFGSLVKLGSECLDVLLLHRAEHLHAWDGAVWRRVRHHTSSGRVKELGISVQTPEELDMIVGIPEVEHIQLPSNLLDWRWEEVWGKISREKARQSVRLHVRSVLLQGLLPLNDHQAWRGANVADVEAIRAWLVDQVDRAGRENITDLCVAYANSVPWADGIVIGVEDRIQLAQIVDYMDRDPLSPAQMEELRASRPFVGAEILDPTRWRHLQP